MGQADHTVRNGHPQVQDDRIRVGIDPKVLPCVGLSPVPSSGAVRRAYSTFARCSGRLSGLFHQGASTAALSFHQGSAGELGD